MVNSHKRPPFWGLKLSMEDGTRVLVVEDKLDERQAILERLLHNCEVTWASDVGSVRRAMESGGPFDAYCLDYDLDDTRGGWMEAGRIIRQNDPRSVAKVVLVHSANTDARAYFELFPASIFIQWDVLATILGEGLVDNTMIDTVLADAGEDPSVDALRDAALKYRGQSPE